MKSKLYRIKFKKSNDITIVTPPMSWEDAMKELPDIENEFISLEHCGYETITVTKELFENVHEAKFRLEYQSRDGAWCRSNTYYDTYTDEEAQLIIIKESKLSTASYGCALKYRKIQV